VGSGFKVCHSEAQSYRAKNPLWRGNSRFFTGKERRFGMTKSNVIQTQVLPFALPV
jgi:hypothetical protein